MVWSAAAVFTPLALLVALYARIAHLDRSIPFAILAVLLAAAFGAATEILGKREDRPGLQTSIALFATGTLAALALALTFALEKGWLTIALALMSLGTAWISLQRPIPFLRSLAAILAGIVVLRDRLRAAHRRRRGRHHADLQLAAVGLWHAGAVVLGRQLSSCAAAATTRRCARWKPPRSCSRCCWRSWKSAMSSTAATSIARRAGLTEVALQVCVGAGDGDRAGTAAAAHRQHRAQCRRDRADAVCRRSPSCSACCMLENPLLWPIDVGGGFFNLLLLGYALPAVLALLLSYAVAGQRRAGYANTIAAGALVLALTYVTLEIRRLYHGPVLTSGADHAAPSNTPIRSPGSAFGVVLLGVGILFNSQRARLASAVVIALTILKAFLIDMSTLTGVYRALSFMCLGLVLVAIGWLYQRILFREDAGRRRRAARAAAAAGNAA